MIAGDERKLFVRAQLGCWTDSFSQEFAQDITHRYAALRSLLVERLHSLFIDLYFITAARELRSYRHGFKAIGIIRRVMHVPKLRCFFVARELFWNRINLLLFVAHNIFAPNRSCHGLK